jgi:hypothetical protein
MLMLAAMQATAEDKIDPVKMRAAVELTRIVRADELQRNLALNSFREMFAEKKIDATQLKCFENADLEAFTRTAAEAFARGLHVEEIRSAAEFYSSPVGAKFMHMVYQMNWEQRPKEFPLKVDGPKQSMTYDEIAELGRYRASVGGLRLSHPLNYLDQPDALEGFARLYLELRMTCEGMK